MCDQNVLNPRDLGDLSSLRVNIIDEGISLGLCESVLMFNAQMAAKIYLQVPISTVPPIIINLKFAL
jgi:hypothetical protein